MYWDVKRIFHEKQEGRLCAQHCLNAVLQGAYYTAIELSELARRLDEQERVQMAENGTESRDYQQFMEQPSSNMDDTGYFSIQVISDALKVWGLELLPYHGSDTRAIECRAQPHLACDAYIFNMQSHWYCIRRFGGEHWFNLNSTLNKPKFMGGCYVSEHIRLLELEGYSIFIVCGALPNCESDLRPPQMIDGDEDEENWQLSSFDLTNRNYSAGDSGMSATDVLIKKFQTRQQDFYQPNKFNNEKEILENDEDENQRQLDAVLKLSLESYEMEMGSSSASQSQPLKFLVNNPNSSGSTSSNHQRSNKPSTVGVNTGMGATTATATARTSEAGGGSDVLNADLEELRKKRLAYLTKDN